MEPSLQIDSWQFERSPGRGPTYAAPTVQRVPRNTLQVAPIRDGNGLCAALQLRAGWELGGGGQRWCQSPGRAAGNWEYCAVLCWQDNLEIFRTFSNILKRKLMSFLINVHSTRTSGAAKLRSGGNPIQTWETTIRGCFPLENRYA